jgi:putative addiction module killer protein
MIRVEEYIRADGSSPYGESFETLDSQAAAKVVVSTLRLSLGIVSNVKWFDGIGELRIDWGPGYRVYLAKHGDEVIVLFGGGTKRRQSNDIERAKMLHGEFKARRKAAKSADQRKPRKR